MRYPAAASPPTTVGPSQPGLGWAATPTGLSTTTMSSSSYRTVSPATGRGATGSPGGGGSSTSSQLPPASRSPLPRTRPSTTTLPASATSAAAVRDSPNSRLSAWSTRDPSSPSGTGSARWTPGDVVTAPIVTGGAHGAAQPAPRSGARRAAAVVGGVGRGVVGGVGGVSGVGRFGGVAAAAAPVEFDAPHREQRAEDATADDRRVGHVEDRPDPAVGGEQRQEVDDAAAQEPGRAEHPVDQVADGAPEHQSQGDGPAGRVEPARRPHDDDGDGDRDDREQDRGALGEGERRTHVAQVGQVQHAAEQADV